MWYGYSNFRTLVTLDGLQRGLAAALCAPSQGRAARLVTSSPLARKLRHGEGGCVPSNDESLCRFVAVERVLP